MTATLPDLPDAPEADAYDFTHGEFTRPMHLAVGGGAVAAGLGLTFLLARDWNPVTFVIFSAAIYFVALYLVVRNVEGERGAKDRLATAVVTGAFLLVLVPLVSVVWTVASRGINRFDADFFTTDMRNVVGEGGGGYHAIIGTLMVTGMAAVISVPVGLFVAIYLVEYGRGWLSRAVTTMVDVMTGIPSIVAGLFAFSLFVTVLGPAHRSGFAGAVALAVLMTPVVVRTSEEMLRLVPNELREASYALGVPKWKTIVRIVIPTAIAGILTGITLAIARVVGETAPLLVTAGFTSDSNWNPFSGRMVTLPVFAYNSYKFPTFPQEASEDRAWAAALTLVLIVAVLFIVARVIARVLQPKGLR